MGSVGVCSGTLCLCCKFLLLLLLSRGCHLDFIENRLYMPIALINFRFISWDVESSHFDAVLMAAGFIVNFLWNQ